MERWKLMYAKPDVLKHNQQTQAEGERERGELEEKRERTASALHSDESPARPVSLPVCQCGDQPVRAGPVGLQQNIRLFNNLHKHIPVQNCTVHHPHTAPWLFSSRALNLHSYIRSCDFKSVTTSHLQQSQHFLQSI